MKPDLDTIESSGAAGGIEVNLIQDDEYDGPSLPDELCEAAKTYLRSEWERTADDTNTWDNYATIIKTDLNPFLKAYNTTTADEIEDFPREGVIKLARHLSDYNGQTPIIRWTRIKHFFRYFRTPVPKLVDEWALEHPLDSQEKNEQDNHLDTPHYYGTPEEVVDELCREARKRRHGDRDELIIRLQFEAGPRRSEQALIEESDIDRDEQSIKIPAGKTPAAAREIVYREETQRLLNRWLGTKIEGDDGRRAAYPGLGGEEDAHDYLFPAGPSADDETHLSAEQINQIVVECAEAAGLQEVLFETVDGRRRRKITSHSLRAGFATYHFQAGTDIDHIRELMGHEHKQQTRKYIDTTDTSREAKEAGRNPGNSDVSG